MFVSKEVTVIIKRLYSAAPRGFCSESLSQLSEMWVCHTEDNWQKMLLEKWKHSSWNFRGGGGGQCLSDFSRDKADDRFGFLQEEKLEAEAGKSL